MAWYLDIVLYLWELFKTWIYTLVVIPFKEPQLLWLLIPVWLSGAFAEFFQEKTGTSMGNATSNATVVLWGSIDWTRQTVSLLSQKVIGGFGNLFLRFLFIAVVFFYGFFIVVFGIKGNKIIKKIGRVREVTYVIAIFTPVLYGVMTLTANHIISAVLFFPLFYGVIELIDKITPNPEPVKEDLEEGKEAGGSLGTLGSEDSFDTKMGKDEFKF